MKMASYIRLSRHANGSVCLSLDINVYIKDELVISKALGLKEKSRNSEHQKTINFVEEFLNENKSFEQLRNRILNVFNDFQKSKYFCLHTYVDKVHFSLSSLSHVSCTMKNNKDSKTNRTIKNEISQTELKEKLASVHEISKAVKYFEDKKCSVCLSNYKEILDEDNHIVIPSCGHPLCCKCADTIVESEKKECPQCREKITAQSFNLIRFNADLTIDTENQRVFL